MSLLISTFSIVGRCIDTNQLGVAVSSAVPAVGSLCSFVKAGVGAISTQSWVNPYLAIDALHLLENGLTSSDVLKTVVGKDTSADLRQIGIVDSKGNSAAWSGNGCTSWCGDLSRANFSVQGNMLIGEETLIAMADAFAQNASKDLAERLMLALEAGNSAGGDKRGKQSAALCIYHTEDYPLLDLRVDEHPQPISELRRILTIARLQLVPFVENMPKRNKISSHLPSEISKILLAPPPDRPGGGGSAP